ncbi:hypothetical protein GALMADRAFT_1124895 [Galerina marginata CBS 339.88]|uniref:Uncharacterized protein n=1 Tax=Galerina marginata (strain CBS 339.88) TaxID=685588 RepID=A0A067TMV5_GALM3|nr:hypothetical protein GALMADRAFT_1124895 [Galerina marginata CBS 339.88]
MEVQSDDVVQIIEGENGSRNLKVEGRDDGYVNFDVRTTMADDDEGDRPDERSTGNCCRKPSLPDSGTAAGRCSGRPDVFSSSPLLLGCGYRRWPQGHVHHATFLPPPMHCLLSPTSSNRALNFERLPMGTR